MAKRPRDLALVIAVICVFGSSSWVVAVAQTQEPNGSQTDRRNPCANAEEASLNEDGNLRKPAQLVALERQHRQTPSDKTVTDELAKELLAIAQYFFYCSSETPRRKYPAAYCLYGQVLLLDNENKDARDARDMIEEIYKSLGRPVPTCPN